MRRNSSRGSASPSTYRGGSGRRRKRRSNRLAKCAAFIVGAYALVASLFYYRATHHDVARGEMSRQGHVQAGDDAVAASAWANSCSNA